MKMKLEKDHWADLIMDSVGDDPERANEFYTQYKRWEMNTVIQIALILGIYLLMFLGVIYGMYWAGVEMNNPPNEVTVSGVFLVWIGAMLGTLMVLVKDSLEVKLRKRAENINYYAGRIEREKGDDQCK